MRETRGFEPVKLSVTSMHTPTLYNGCSKGIGVVREVKSHNIIRTKLKKEEEVSQLGEV